MKIIRQRKCRTVSANGPEDFDEKFNAVSLELGTDAELKWEETKPYTVHLIYTEVTKVAETMKEEYEEVLGEKYYCIQCPYFELGKNRKESSKGCTKDNPLAVDYTPACELFYKELAQGLIKPRR